MNTPDQIKIFFTMFLWQLPVLIVCLVACFVILTKWKRASDGSLWALLGFGSVVVLCIAMPAVQAVIQGWVFQGGQRADKMWALSAASTVWAVLHAMIYVFLLMAVLAGRSTPNPTSPPPLNPNS
jgi:hypothetical protein